MDTSKDIEPKTNSLPWDDPEHDVMADIGDMMRREYESWPILPTYICQVNGDPILPCPEMNGGYQCEYLGAGPHRHFIGNHTIEHALAGNGYYCSAIEEYLRETD